MTDPTPDWRTHRPDQLLRDCRVETYRASGPGGQKRNKTSSAVRLTHLPTGIVATATESRSQHDNKAKALDRLRRTIAIEVRRSLDADAFVAPDWFDELRTGGGLRVSTRAEIYPSVLGLILDVLQLTQWGVSDAARVLHMTTGGLVQFLRDDEFAWAAVNQHRAAAGLRPLIGR